MTARAALAYAAAVVGTAALTARRLPGPAARGRRPPIGWSSRGRATP